MRIRRTTGFTLIEILVVMGISMLLLGLIMGPVVQSFNLTRRAQVMVQAQSTARQTMEKISREISEAMFVYDNTRSPIVFPIPDWNADPNGRTKTYFEVYGAKLDLVLPKLVMHCNKPDPKHDVQGGPRDYERGNEAWPPCPVCGSTNVEARPASPRRPDDKIVRYFVGLLDNDPGKHYLNSYDEASGQRTSSDPDNPFVLYRVEFSLSDERLCPADVDPSDRIHYLLGDDTPTGKRGRNFFYDESPSAAAGGTSVWKQWKNIARVVGPDRDIDMVEVKWDKNHTPLQVTPALRFMPTGIDNDTLAATYVSDADAEVPNAVPTTFRAGYGLWCPNFRVIVDDLQADGQQASYYYTEHVEIQPGEWHLLIRDQNGDLVFDATAYENTRNQPSPALNGNLKLMFTVDADRGMVSFAFPGEVYIDDDEVKAINKRFHDDYQKSLNESGRGQAIRELLLGPLPVDEGLDREFQTARIVPGTEVLTGPDMMPGPNYGAPIRYDRVPWNLGDPGRNQYKINYETGEIQFSSAYDEDIPETGPITLTFRYHKNTPTMVVKAHYMTKMLISVGLAMRLYDDVSGKLQVVELSSKIRLRNAMR